MRCQPASEQLPTRTSNFSSPIQSTHRFISSASGEFGPCASANIIVRWATRFRAASNGSGSGATLNMITSLANNALEPTVNCSWAASGRARRSVAVRLKLGR